MPANHSQTGRATVHLIDLRDVLEFADAFFLFAEMPLFINEGRSLIALSRRLFAIERRFVMHPRFRRNQLLGKIERNARLRFRLILRQPLFQ
jgi:hypothetical protein